MSPLSRCGQETAHKIELELEDVDTAQERSGALQDVTESTDEEEAKQSTNDKAGHSIVTQQSSRFDAIVARHEILGILNNDAEADALIDANPEYFVKMTKRFL